MSQPITCPFCGTESPATARDCTVCGSPLTPKATNPAQEDQEAID